MLLSVGEVVETSPGPCRKEKVVEVDHRPSAVSSGEEFRSMEAI